MTMFAAFQCDKVVCPLQLLSSQVETCALVCCYAAYGIGNRETAKATVLLLLLLLFTATCCFSLFTVSTTHNHLGHTQMAQHLRKMN